MIRRAAACLLPLALLAGCGLSTGGDPVALQAADGAPGQDGAPGASSGQGAIGGNGGKGGAAGSAKPTSAGESGRDDGLAGASRELLRCIHRNDDVVPWRSSGITETTGWDSEHRQDAHVRVITAVYERLGLEEGHRNRALTGFLGYDLDPVGSRLIMLVDPDIIDIGEFRSWVNGIARKANKAAHVRGTALTVTVQKGCFPAREINAVIEDMPRDHLKYDIQSLIGHAALDGRVHAAFHSPAGAGRMQRHYGPVLAVDSTNAKSDLA